MTQISKTIYNPEVQTRTSGKEIINLNPNTKQAGLATSSLRFLESAEGLFRFGQLGERLPKFINEARAHYGMPRSAPLDDCSKKSFQAWTWLTTIPRALTMTPGTIEDIKNAAAACNDSTVTLQQKRYKIEKAMSEATDTAAMYSYSFGNIASMFSHLSKQTVGFLSAGSTLTTVHDGFNLHLNVENLTHALSADTTKATREIKETVAGTIRYSMLAALKDATAVASGVFALLGAAVPAVALAALSLASTVFAVCRKLYEESMPFKPISFLDHRHVSLITA